MSAIVEFRGVSYSAGGRPVLEDFNLSVIVKTHKITLKAILQGVQQSEIKEHRFGLYMHLDKFQIKKFDWEYLTQHWERMIK